MTQVAPITANALLLHGTGSGSNGSNFTLTNTSNSVTQFAAASPVGGQVQLANCSALSIEQLSGTGIDAATNAPTTIAAPNTVSFGDLFVSAAGNLSLRHNISTVGSDIDLVTNGVLNNFGSGTITPGGSGRFRVWANTWVGETRGGLVGTSRFPNFYGCTYPGTCVSSVTIPPTGNHFVYQAQPTLTFTTPDQQRPLGAPNPPFPVTSVSGLLTQLGDTQADALNGSFSTPATVFSNAGQYPIVGTFTSPTGYILQPAPATLTITPEPLYPLITNIPTFDRTPGTGDTNVYASGFLLPSMCIATEPMVSSSGLAVSGEILEIEWARVQHW